CGLALEALEVTRVSYPSWGQANQLSRRTSCTRRRHLCAARDTLPRLCHRLPDRASCPRCPVGAPGARGAAGARSWASRGPVALALLARLAAGLEGAAAHHLMRLVLASLTLNLARYVLLLLGGKSLIHDARSSQQRESHAPCVRMHPAPDLFRARL